MSILASVQAWRTKRQQRRREKYDEEHAFDAERYAEKHAFEEGAGETDEQRRKKDAADVAWRDRGRL
jgi:hypothetical protein